jgi:hypothetical protein
MYSLVTYQEVDAARPKFADLGGERHFPDDATTICAITAEQAADNG